MMAAAQLKVLLIEDNPLDAPMVELSLPAADFSLSVCERLEQALELVKTSAFHLSRREDPVSTI